MGKGGEEGESCSRETETEAKRQAFVRSWLMAWPACCFLTVSLWSLLSALLLLLLLLLLLPVVVAVAGFVVVRIVDTLLTTFLDEFVGFLISLHCTNALASVFGSVFAAAAPCAWSGLAWLCLTAWFIVHSLPRLLACLFSDITHTPRGRLRLLLLHCVSFAGCCCCCCIDLVAAVAFL